MPVNLLFKGLCMDSDHKTDAENNTATVNTNKQPQSRTPEKETLLAEGGEMGERIRSFDWSTTPLGPIDTWSTALLTTVRILLANRFPLLLWWGSQYISIYNNAYIPILGEKHPWALGKPVHECWKEIWHILQPLIDTPFHGGPPTWDEDISLELNRYGFTEETHFTIAYSPVPDESEPQGIGGVLATVTEITEKVIGERRIVVLRDLAARVGEARTAEEACAIAAETLTGHARDVPFALLYLLDEEGRHARLASTVGTPEDDTFRPAVIDLDTLQVSVWPLKMTSQTGRMQVVENLRERFPSVPPGPWSDSLAAVILPIPSNRPNDPAGLLVAGLSTRLKFDQAYQDFIGLVRTQIAAAIANARVYEAERHRSEDLAEIDRAKTAFFSNVSHEFRTPLTLMLGPLENLLAQNHISAIDREQLALVHRNAMRQLKLVNTLLDFSRIEAGRMEASYEPVDLAFYTAELASVFRSAIEHAGLKLIVDCPALDEPVFVDREMWEKIVLNLLSNAFKFTFEGQIEVSMRKSGKMAELTVKDTGVGISPDELPHMFERFHRVRGAQSRTHEGTGIGLALVKELVQLHEGQIQISSRENEGTTFKISIPTGMAHLPQDRIATARNMRSTALSVEPYLQEALSWLPEEGGQYPITRTGWPDYPASHQGVIDRNTAAVPKRKYHILLADDNKDMRKYIERLLVESDYQVESVADGQLALRAARTHHPDLMLIDVMMPGLDGFELLRELRGDPSTALVPVIMLSARAGEEARVEGMQAGADDYLIKPFSAYELLARVKSHLEIASIRNEAAKTIHNRAAQFETLLKQAPLGVYLIDEDFRILEMNPTALSVFGENLNLIGRDFSEVIHLLWTKDYADDLVRIFHHTLETGEPFESPEQTEYRIDRNAKEYYEWRLDRILLPNGRYGVVCYFRDISVQVLARARLSESEERYRGIVNQSVGAIAEADATGRFTTVNDRFCEMTGYSREELMDLRMLDLTHPEDLPRSRVLLESLAAGGASYEIEKRYIRKDGSVIWVHKSASAIRDANGNVRSLIAVLIDITKNKQTEIALQQLNMGLENLVQERTAALQSANQALRELSRRLVEVQEEERRAIARELHDRAGQTLSALNINLTIMNQQLSEDSKLRIGSRLIDTMKLTADVIDLIRNVVSDLRPTVLYDYGLQAATAAYLKEYQIRYGIEVHFSPSTTAIPRLEPGVAMTALRIIQEALTNVARHAQAKKVHVSINLQGDVIHLVVEDDGVGIAESQRIGHSNSHGLKIMRERAEAFGGSVTVGLAPERGTRVKASIPIQATALLSA